RSPDFPNGLTCSQADKFTGVNIFNLCVRIIGVFPGEFYGIFMGYAEADKGRDIPENLPQEFFWYLTCLLMGKDQAKTVFTCPAENPTIRGLGNACEGLKFIEIEVKRMALGLWGIRAAHGSKLHF